MILFLDDDVDFLRYYCDELRERGWDVAAAFSTDDAHRIVMDRGEELKVVVLDMMMPPGRIFEDENTEYGIRTGELFYEKLRSMRPVVPVVLFTNRNADHLDCTLRDDSRCRIFMKEDLLPGEFADMIDDLLGRAHAHDEKGTRHG